MGFVASIVSAVVDVVVGIVMAVVQIVEVVIQLIMVLLGYDGGSSQTIEYFEVRNYPLFEDVDNKNPIQQSVLQSVLSDKDLSASLIYHIVFRSLKGNVKEFMQFIENGNYFEGFPQLDSYITIINYTELNAALQTLNGVPCTPEVSALRALSQADWIKYWLQENKDYDIGTNILGAGYATVSTPVSSPANTVKTQSTNFISSITDEGATSDSVVIDSASAINTSPTTTTSTYALNTEFIVNITDEITTSDAVSVDQRWQVNFGTVVYNAIPDTYTVQVYNVVGTVRTLSYTVPSKPSGLHYVVEYYQNSVPSRTYLFVYKVGTGTYPDLDTVEEPINMDNTVLQAIPAVPLRISNANYTTFGATKKQQIEDLLAILNLDASEIIDGVLSDSGLAPGDVDNVYVNFGVRMWDTSQAGMSYLFRMFENLFPAQGSTQGTYNNTASGDDKPTNNILTTTEDKNDAFQFNYITYEFTSLTDINANSGSAENGIYYSDMSKFGDDGLLRYQYYNSSGKGTYNVGYKADNLTEVQDFLDGNGVVNPGTTTTEAANWLQVTERLSYNNPSPVLQESDGSTSSIIYLTPDAVYENNGSGVLRYVQQASEETTSGQSITYYCIKPNGLDAYTVAAPIAAMRVVDGATGVFKTVKFNLGAKGDLMVPFIYTFVKDLSNTQAAQLFLAGAHVSIYIAHYEVIVQAGMGFFQALVLIIILVVIIYFTVTSGGADGGSTLKTFLVALGKAAAAGTLALIKFILIKLATYAFKFIVQKFIQLIIAELTDDPFLRALLGMLANVAIASWEGELTYDDGSGGMFDDMGDMIGDVTVSDVSGGGFSFQNMTSFRNPMDFTGVEILKVANYALQGIGSYRAAVQNEAIEALMKEGEIWSDEYTKKQQELQDLIDRQEARKVGIDLSRTLYTGWEVGGTSFNSLPSESWIQATSAEFTITKNFEIYDIDQTPTFDT
ncbi:hypothetical protein OAW27_00205 [bacterium]|nr:hypothetical protein [bacterium]